MRHLALLLALALWAAYAAVRAYAFPYRPCPYCEGTGKRLHARMRTPGTCTRCRGTGIRLRPVMFVVNHLRGPR